MERNNSKQTKVSFNIIDVFILIFVVACFVGLVMRIGNFSILDNNEDLNEYRIHFSVSDISSDSSDYFIMGDTITVADRGLVLGKLEMIDSISPTEILVEVGYNEFKKVKYPSETRVDISGTIISPGTMDYNGFKLGGVTHIAPGETFLVHTEHMNFVMTVTDIAKK